MDERKTCGRCRAKKPADEFYVVKGKLSPYCRACTKAYMADWRQRHLVVERERDRAYYARTRDEQAQKRKERWASLSSEEKQRQLDKLTAWNRAHPEVGAERQRRWKEKNPERARALQERHRQTPGYKAKHREYVRQRRALTSYQVYDNARRAGVDPGAPPLTLDGWLRILAAFDYRCAYCGTRPYKPEMDHATPICRGGTHVPGNVVPACRSCNARKRHRTLEEFCALRGLDADAIREKMAA